MLEALRIPPLLPSSSLLCGGEDDLNRMCLPSVFWLLFPGHSMDGVTKPERKVRSGCQSPVTGREGLTPPLSLAVSCWLTFSYSFSLWVPGMGKLLSPLDLSTNRQMPNYL